MLPRVVEQQVSIPVVYISSSKLREARRKLTALRILLQEVELAAVRLVHELLVVARRGSLRLFARLLIGVGEATAQVAQEVVVYPTGTAKSYRIAKAIAIEAHRQAVARLQIYLDVAVAIHQLTDSRPRQLHRQHERAGGVDRKAVVHLAIRDRVAVQYQLDRLTAIVDDRAGHLGDRLVGSREAQQLLGYLGNLLGGVDNARCGRLHTGRLAGCHALSVIVVAYGETINDGV